MMMCAITSRWCKSRLNLVAGLSEKVSRRILVFTGSFGFKWKYLLETGDLEDDLQISKMFMNSRAMCLASIKNMRWQIHLNHFNKDSVVKDVAIMMILISRMWIRQRKVKKYFWFVFPFPYFTIISASLQWCSSEAVAQHLGRRDRAAAASNEVIFWFNLKPIFQELGKSGAGGRGGGGVGRAGRRGRFYTESSQERGGEVGNKKGGT